MMYTSSHICIMYVYVYVYYICDLYMQFHLFISSNRYFYQPSRVRNWHTRAILRAAVESSCEIIFTSHAVYTFRFIEGCLDDKQFM